MTSSNATFNLQPIGARLARRRGEARRGEARRGEARRGEARRGEAVSTAIQRADDDTASRDAVRIEVRCIRQTGPMDRHPTQQAKARDPLRQQIRRRQDLRRHPSCPMLREEARGLLLRSHHFRRDPLDTPATP